MQLCIFIVSSNTLLKSAKIQKFILNKKEQYYIKQRTGMEEANICAEVQMQR